MTLLNTERKLCAVLSMAMSTCIHVYIYIYTYVSFHYRTVTNFPVCSPAVGSPTIPSMESAQEKEGPVMS